MDPVQNFSELVSRQKPIEQKEKWVKATSELGSILGNLFPKFNTRLFKSNFEVLSVKQGTDEN